MRIGELADRTGVSAKTIRYYESVGLIDEPGRQPNGYRDYSSSAASRLAFVRSAQGIGLTLGEIRGVIAFRDRGEVPCVHVADLIQRHADEVSAKIEALEKARGDLERLARRARRLSPSDCEKAEVCHIIEGQDGSSH
ncbi:MAG: heavy metal-responsive transcriptional regulator [Actinomycetota bacterium]